MVLVDTSIWVDHLHAPDTRLQEALRAGDVIAHPFIIGELACGNLRQRARVLSLLESLPTASVATHEEVLTLLGAQRLFGKGLGYIDVHLLASARLSHVKLWTRDKNLRRAAVSLELSFKE